MVLTSWLVLAPSHFNSSTRLFPFPSSLYLSEFTSILYFMLTLSLLFIFHFLLPVSPCYFLPPPTTIHLFPCNTLPFSLHPSIPSVLPGGQATLTCICLAWMSPRFGLNAPIILLNYDVQLLAVLRRLCGSLMKVGTVQRNHLLRPD